MSRRKSSPAEDFIDIASSLPWWVGSPLAFLSYSILHQFSDLTIEQPAGIGQMGDVVVGQMFKTMALFGQYVLSALFLIGALASFIKQRKRSKLYASLEIDSFPDPVNRSPSFSRDPLQSMSWFEFEQLIARFFTGNGFSVKDTPLGPDGGVDLFLKKTVRNILYNASTGRSSKLMCKQFVNNLE